MDGGWGSFRTVDGNVSVGDDVLRIERSPRKFLRGQRIRWQNGDHGQRFAALGKLCWFVLTPLFAIYHVSMALGMTTGVAAALSFGTVALTLLQFVREHTRETSVRLSGVENVALDTGDRELTITHDASGRLAGLTTDVKRRLSGDGASSDGSVETETSLALLTAADGREARTVLRTRGIRVSDAAEAETETEYRFEREDGFAFCERCGSRVSPREGTCPTCEYALRVERPMENDARELSTEC